MRRLIFWIIGILLVGVVGYGLYTNLNTGMDHSEMAGMNHSDTSLPNNMTNATDPEFPVGSKVKITADHMNNMQGATGTVTGAYKTYVYAVTYTPTTGGAPVADHKWVVQEELNSADDPAKEGDTVVLNTSHMAGMMGAKATVDSVDDTTVYAVTYKPTNGGSEVKNHKWLIGSELEAQ